MSCLTIRPAEPEERSKLLRLLVDSYGEKAGHWSEAYWRWKHEANPFGPSYVLVAEEAGRLVGLRAFLRWRFRSGERTVATVRAVDTATHPDYRRRGIFSRLTREALEWIEADGVAFVFNTPNVRSRLGYLQLGWLDAGRVPLRLRPLRPLRILLPGSKTEDAEPSLESFPTAADFLASPDFDPSMLHWRDSRLHTERNRAYLAWRYCDIPARRYRALWAREGDAFAALCFHGRRRWRRREVTLSEILLTPDPKSRALARRLLRRLARDAEADYLVASVAAGTPELGVLRRAGFLPVPGVGPRLTVRPVCIAGSPVDPCTWESWRCSIGDLEIF